MQYPASQDNARWDTRTAEEIISVATPRQPGAGGNLRRYSALEQHRDRVPPR